MDIVLGKTKNETSLQTVTGFGLKNSATRTIHRLIFLFCLSLHKIFFNTKFCMNIDPTSSMHLYFWLNFSMHRFAFIFFGSTGAPKGAGAPELLSGWSFNPPFSELMLNFSTSYISTRLDLRSRAHVMTIGVTTTATCLCLS